MTYMCYRYINRGLYEKDKLTFVLLVTMKILITAALLKTTDFTIFLRGGAALDINSVSRAIILQPQALSGATKASMTVDEPFSSCENVESTPLLNPFSANCSMSRRLDCNIWRASWSRSHLRRTRVQTLSVSFLMYRQRRQTLEPTTHSSLSSKAVMGNLALHSCPLSDYPLHLRNRLALLECRRERWFRVFFLSRCGSFLPRSFSLVMSTNEKQNRSGESPLTGSRTTPG